MRKSVSAGWVEKLVESWLRFQNNYRHSVSSISPEIVMNVKGKYKTSK